MTESAVAIRQEEPTLTPFEVIERVIASGDLSKMSPQDRVAFYWRTCESTGLNPLTRPFEFITLSGKLTMYAKKDATDQLRRIHRVSIDTINQEIQDDILTVTATGHTPDGRQDLDVGSVNLKGLSGEARANAIKKAITQAKRRLTLSLVGLGFLDESEIDGAHAEVDPTTGVIAAPSRPASLLDQVRAQQVAMAGPSADAGETEIEGEAVDAADDLFAEASPAPTRAPLADILRDTAAASGLTGPATQSQRDALQALLMPLGKDRVLAGVQAAFGAGLKEISAAQAQAVLGLAESEGHDAFRERWAELAA